MLAPSFPRAVQLARFFYCPKPFNRRSALTTSALFVDVMSRFANLDRHERGPTKGVRP